MKLIDAIGIALVTYELDEKPRPLPGHVQALRHLNEAIQGSQTNSVSNCGGCPFLRSGASGLNVCGRMPNDLGKDHLPKYAINDDWRAPLPVWCPLRKGPVVIQLKEG